MRLPCVPAAVLLGAAVCLLASNPAWSGKTSPAPRAVTERIPAPAFESQRPPQEWAVQWMRSFKAEKSPEEILNLAKELATLAIGGGDNGRAVALEIYAIHLAERTRIRNQLDLMSMKRIQKLSAPRPSLGDFLSSLLGGIEQRVGPKAWKQIVQHNEVNAKALGLEWKDSTGANLDPKMPEVVAATIYKEVEESLLKRGISVVSEVRKFTQLLSQTPIIQKMVSSYGAELEYLLLLPDANGALTEDSIPLARSPEIICK